MSLIRWRREPLALEDMSQMTSAVRAGDFNAGHTEAPVLVPRYRARDTVEIGRPPAARFELVGCFVEGGVAACAGVDAL